MLNTIFATKGGMSQVWTKQGKRLPVTKCMVEDNVVLGQQKCIAVDYRTEDLQQKQCNIFEIGYGKKKLSNMPKPLREIIKQSGFSFGVKQIKGIKYFADEEQEPKSPIKVGDILDLTQVLAVGDIVKVKGTSKGRGFTGVVKRYGVKGGPRTHGQRDRERHIGSIGAMTDPGRVLKGRKMPGHHGGETKTIENLVVTHIDSEKREVWLSGPIPGHLGSVVRIIKTNDKKDIELNKKASGIAQEAEEKSKAQSKAKPQEKKQEKQPEVKKKQAQKKENKKGQKEEQKQKKTKSGKKEDKNEQPAAEAKNEKSESKS